MADNNKLPYILLTDYSNLYKSKYGKAPRINKFREKWAMQDVIDSIGFDKAQIISKLNQFERMKKTIEDKINTLSLSNKDKDDLRTLVKMFELDILEEYNKIINFEEMSYRIYLRVNELKTDLKYFFSG